MSTRISLLGVAALLAACSGADAVPGYSRETAPDGRVIVTYASGLPVREDTLTPLVEIGKYVDDSSRIFDDLRDLAVDARGRILALDYKAAEIRVFGPDGTPAGTIGRRGEGPGEFSNANGLRITEDGTIWVNDHGKAMLLALAPDGTELRREPRIVPGYGYRWGVAIDTAGMFWEPWTQRTGATRPDPTTTGRFEGTSAPMYETFDPATGARDSVITLGTTSWRSYVASYNNGQAFTGLPFDGHSFMTMDPRHRVWTGSTDRYDLARITMTSDTTLELHVAESGLPVTDADVSEWREGLKTFAERVPTIVSDLMAYMPEHKPPLEQPFTDDRDRLWVRREVGTGEPARWDVFSPDGAFLITIRGPANVVSFLPPVIHGDRVYLVAEGEAGERYIVVAGLPVGLLGEGQ